MTKATDDRVLLVRTTDEELRVTIPADFKVTYGRVQPGARGYDEGYCLRIYESDTKQRAVFVNVVSFRDLSIPVQRRVKTVKNSAKSKRDSKGNAELSDKTTVSEGEWEDA